MIKTAHTIVDALIILEGLFEKTKDDEKANIMNSKDSNVMYEYHMGLGRMLRNEWKLWENSKLAQELSSYGILHPDEMSGELLRLFWEYKHQDKFNIEEFVEKAKNELIIKDIIE